MVSPPYNYVYLTIAYPIAQRAKSSKITHSETLPWQHPVVKDLKPFTWKEKRSYSGPEHSISLTNKAFLLKASKTLSGKTVHIPISLTK